VSVDKDWVRYLKETGNWDSYDGTCNCYQCKKVVAGFDAWKLKQMNPMTPDQLHLEVLKAMGWKWKDSNETAFGASQPLKKWHNPQGKVATPPPLTLDLMWQAEEMLSEARHDEHNMSEYVEDLS
jgi:hypothetical protein